MNCELHSEVVVAHHEAAHMVVAHLLGADVGGITLEATTHPNASLSWHGTARIDCLKLPGESKAKIGIAGSLAEIKACAAQCVKKDFCALTLPENSVPAIAKALLKARNAKDGNSAFAKTTLITDDGTTYDHDHFLGESLDDMDRVSKAVREIAKEDLSEELLIPLVEETRQILEDAAISHAVADVAKRLIDQHEVPIVRKELGEKWVRIILQSIQPRSMTKALPQEH